MTETVSKAVLRVEFLGYPDADGLGIQFTGMSVTADPSLMTAETLVHALPQLLAHAVGRAVEGNYIDLTELDL